MLPISACSNRLDDASLRTPLLILPACASVGCGTKSKRWVDVERLPERPHHCDETASEKGMRRMLAKLQVEVKRDAERSIARRFRGWRRR